MNNQFKIKTTNGKQTIFDLVRKKFVALTPEEWVRQHFLYHIITEKKYPSSLISVEKKINIGGISRRFDVLVFKNSIPWMLVECKSENIEINDRTLQQILAYNSNLKTSFLTITNGKSLHCFDIENHVWQHTLPHY